VKTVCQNSKCSFFNHSQYVRKDGFYFRRDDSQRVQRFYCSKCKKSFSSSTSTLEYKQKKRRVNNVLRKLLCAKVSIRRCAIILDINKNTVLRKIIYLSKKSQQQHQTFLDLLEQPIISIQFDDLITKEQSKLKPLLVTIAVDVKSRMIIAATVSQIAAFGHLSKKAVKKYGKRKSNHFQKANEMFEKVACYIDPKVIITTDEHKRYPDIIKKHFPFATHKAYKSSRACIVGQGEMKKNARDPLFRINHTCASFRDNISRLIRSSWCLSQKAEMLQHHINKSLKLIFNRFY